MSFDSLQERLTALQETTAQVQELIDRLANLKFQPGSVPLPNGDGYGEDDENVATELSSEINNTLREEEEDLELLEEEITDLRGGKDGSDAARQKERLKEGAARLEGEIKSCRVSFHRAQLTARRSLEAAQRLERELLLQSYTRAASTPSRSGANSPAPSANPTAAPPRRRHTQKAAAGHGDPTVAASSDLTVSLRRAHQAVTEELSRSIAVHEALQDSTLKMKSLGANYSRMDDMLRSSRDLVGVLLKSTKTDTWYLQTTFYMLAATLSWLVFRRFMYGPLWWLVWLPVRLVFRTGSTAVGLVGGKPGATMEVGVGSEGGQSAKVVGVGEEGAVPTAQVGQGNKAADDPDSMVDKVGRVIDRIEEQVGGMDGLGEQPAAEAEAEAFEPVSAGDGIAQEAPERLRDEL
ncbi:sec20 domain-containing protein [Diaporthe amygdali]|uniref:sec20 domain-containing protein n=1 Tax=Phomopsis amygdali TaxID=1214568 RepID=UPI0022FF244A|nr:sec20 domain-containing protein [Diaporthe amygdali]KAJ0107837.1 sec20 domain-containing protein [Diaporthe amygdali]